MRSPRPPEELIFPRREVIGLVDVREQAGEDADAVQDLRRNRLVGVGEASLGLQRVQPGDAGIDERLEVLLRRCLSA